MHPIMEPFSLLILFVAMIVVWIWTWAPWKPHTDDPLDLGRQPDSSGTDERSSPRQAARRPR